jgi:two-component system, sensor histidine kinase SagS
VLDRPRILVLEGSGRAAGDLLQQCRPDWDLIRVGSVGEAAALVQRDHFDAVYADTHDEVIWSGARHLFEADEILARLSDGVAVVSRDLRVTWANATFERWCGGSPVGRLFYEALGSPEVLGPDYCPFHSALTGKTVTTRIHCRDNRYFELHVTPVPGNEGAISHMVCLGRNVTAEVQQQQKLDALYQAGHELAALAPDQLAEMSMDERIELLKQNIRRLTHDLLHYDVIKICLLDRQSGNLQPLLQEGMAPGAAERVLRANAEKNGITGFVAATGKSYLCPDTATDSLYLEGAPGARSSLTVPLVVQDEVIGTFNIESPELNAFGEEDLKFAEIFGREIASALHTLQLLTAEKRSATSQSVDAISRAVVMPVDEILAAATAVLDQYIGHDREMGDKLRQILASARAIKESIHKVGEDLAGPVASAQPGELPHPRLKGLRLLLADSDERVRRSAHSILGRYGCVVETARDGKEALTMAKISNYDAMLADIRLPDVSGYEVYKRLREAQPHAKVILMTAYGYDASHSIVKARQDGLRQVLYKPFRVDQLLDALENNCDGESGPPRRGV